MKTALKTLKVGIVAIAALLVSFVGLAILYGIFAAVPAVPLWLGFTVGHHIIPAIPSIAYTQAWMFTAAMSTLGALVHSILLAIGATVYTSEQL